MPIKLRHLIFINKIYYVVNSDRLGISDQNVMFKGPGSITYLYTGKLNKMIAPNVFGMFLPALKIQQHRIQMVSKLKNTINGIWNPCKQWHQHHDGSLLLNFTTLQVSNSQEADHHLHEN